MGRNKYSEKNAVDRNSSSSHSSKAPASPNSKSVSFEENNDESPQVTECVVCHGPTYHVLDECDEFTEMTTAERYDVIKKHGLCLNCFGRHLAYHCPQLFRCKECGAKHNILLHRYESVKE